MRSVLVFDMDDTLFPEWQFVESGFRAVDRWMSAEHAIFGFGARATEVFRAGRRGTIFDEVLAGLGLAAAAIAVGDLLAVYREHVPEIALHEDARWAIDRFAPSHRLALLTDGYLATQRRKVAALGIEPVFEAIVYSDEFGRERWKPHPRPYEAVMERMGCDGGSCTYVSDNPAKDFVTANALGWDTVHVVRADGEYHGAATMPGYAARRQIGSLLDLGSG